MTQFYDLIQRQDGKLISPFAWRSLFALKHKELSFEHHSLTLTQIQDQIPKLTNGEWHQVPLVKFDDGKVVYDSATIADYLEANVHTGSKLFPNGKSYATFLENYFQSNIQPIFFSVLMHIYNGLDEENKIYFRKSREGWFGTTLENVTAQPQVQAELVEKYLNPFSVTLKSQKFLEGEQPTYSDYIVFAQLRWLDALNHELFEKLVSNNEDKTLSNYYNSIQELHGGFAKSL